jgi:hypothetical protein
VGIQSIRYYLTALDSSMAIRKVWCFMSKRVITLDGGQRLSLARYLEIVRYAKAHPEYEFTRGFTCWWPCTGHEIMRQFRQGITDRINQAVPYAQRGI